MMSIHRKDYHYRIGTYIIWTKWGNKKASTYKQLKQVPSDDDIDSCDEEYTVFDKNDRSTIQLQLVPSATQNRNRQLEEVNIKRLKTNWRQCLLLCGVIVVAISGLAIGVVLVRLLNSPLESRTDNVTITVAHYNTTQSGSEKSQGVTDASKVVTELDATKLHVPIVTESNYAEDITPGSDGTIKWEKTWKDVSGESCVRLLDVDGDGLEDILVGTATSRKHFDVEASVGTGKYDDLKDLCHEQGESYPCQGHIIALRGYDGQLLWNLTVRSEVFMINCEHFDLDLDGKSDCVGTGRKGVVVAFNPYTGHLYWSAEDDSVFNAGWNTYRALILPDWDKDGVPEVLIANGGDPTKEPEEHDRAPGRLVVLSGRTGQMVGERYLVIPNSKETYMSPVMYHRPNGEDIILFGSGGETVPGDLMGIPVTSLCHYVYGEAETADKCPPEKAEKGLFTIVSGVEKGVMVPPVIIDVNGDSVNDILISMFEGKLVLKNGWDLSIMWTASFPGTETYSTPAPGYFDDDDVIDFMVHLSTGTWPRYNVSNVTVISGKDGSVLWTMDSASFEMNSDLVIQTSEPHRDLFLFKIKGRGSPYSHRPTGEIIRKGNVKREKRHGGETPVPEHNGLPPGTIYDKSYFEKEYRKYHITCDDDLTNHRGEMFMIDRSSMKQPIKILDMPLKKFWYDAPVHVVEPMPGSNNDNRQDQNEPTSHMNGEMPHQEGSGSGGQRGPRGDLNNTGSEKMCVLMDSDDRSTGAIADLDNDGILEYISIYTSYAQAVDSMYSYVGMIFNYNIKVVNLNLRLDQFKSIPVPSTSSFTLNQPLKDVRSIHPLPYSDQKWTQYMGKHGDSHYRGHN